MDYQYYQYGWEFGTEKITVSYLKQNFYYSLEIFKGIGAYGKEMRERT